MTGATIRLLGWLTGAFIAGLSVIGLTSPAQAVTTDFVSTWNPANTSPGSSAANQITLPLESTGTYDFTVKWGDGSTDTITSWNQAEVTHTYTAPVQNSYTIRINRVLKGWRFNDAGDRLKILNISTWGNIDLGNGGDYFRGAENLTSTATDSPDLTDTDNFSGFFWRATAFNGDISSWDTSKVENMSFMFTGAASFNQKIGAWKTGAVTSLHGTFFGAEVFNQPLAGWDTSKVENMSGTFQASEVFNQDIGGWKTGSVKDMSYMFNRTTKFNQDIGDWNTSAVTDMSYMLFGATAFDQDLSAWNVGNADTLIGLLDESGLTTPNYDKILVGWSGQGPLKTNVPFGAATTKYSCAATTARQSLIDNYTWNITDDGPTAEGCFESTWTTEELTPGSSADTQIRLPLESSGTYDFVVDWGDGTSSIITTWDQVDVTHTYPSAGTYSVRISGILSGWRFAGSGDRNKILRLDRWGGQINLGNNGDYFSGCENLTSTATDSPDLTGTTNLSGAFARAEALNGGIAAWDTTDVTDMSYLLLGARAFNQDISGWKTSAVTTMAGMFQAADDFNQDISGWNMSGVTDVSFMFDSAQAFDQPIGLWKTGNVTTMRAMFVNAVAFNQDLSGWDTSAVTTMERMFDTASLFNQPVGGWDVSQVSDAADMFSASGLSTTNYDQVLISWAALPAVQPAVTLGAQGVRYSCAAQAARASLIDDHAWVIDDAGAEACVKVSPNPVAFAATTVDQSRAITVTVTNPGGLDLVLPANALSLAGADGGQFTLVTDTCSGMTVSPAGSCTGEVRFSPTASGNKNATLRVLSNALSSPDAVPVSGSAVLPAFIASPGSLPFAAQRVGTSSDPQAVTVTNGGPGTLILPAAGVTTSGDAAFTIVADTCSGMALTPAQTCAVSVRFSPTTTGQAFASLGFTTNAPGAPHAVSLSGSGFKATKKKQTLAAKLPKRIKPNGITVITPADARTNAGQRVRTLVRGGPIKASAAGQVRYYTIIRGPEGEVSVRTFGYPDLRLRVVQRAPAITGYTAFKRSANYVRGIRR